MGPSNMRRSQRAVSPAGTFCQSPEGSIPAGLITLVPIGAIMMFCSKYDDRYSPDPARYPEQSAAARIGLVVSGLLAADRHLPDGPPRLAAREFSGGCVGGRFYRHLSPFPPLR